MKTIENVDLKDKTVLVRVDYNVPLENGQIKSDLRLRASFPTLNYLRSHGAKKIILISHLGRPEGEDKSLSLAPVAENLNETLGHVSFIEAISGPAVASAVEKMQKGDILLLENLRFYPGEKENSPDFIKSILDATHPDLYVQDGFAVVHRAHASTSVIADFLPVYAGLLLKKEVENLKKSLENPDHPLVLIIGGSKVEDKQPLIDKFSPLADKILVGGKIAADGYRPTSDKILVATDFDEDASGAKLDIGPLSTAKFLENLETARTIIWNGVLGKVEDPAYATASELVATTLGKMNGATIIICGGDTTGFVENLQKTHENLNYTLISTGGGAALEFLLGKKLPGLAPILS